MGTLQSMVSTLPHPLQVRYRGTDGLGAQWISWINDGLIKFEQERLLPEIIKETGVEVKNDVWITPPSGYRYGIEIFNPLQPSIIYPFRESENKLRLTAALTFDKQSDTEAVSAFSAQAAATVELNIIGHGEDDMKNFLLVITAGTLASRTYILSANADSGVSTTQVTYLHELSTAWIAAQATAGYLVDSNQYLILRYIETFTPMTVLSEEIPIANKFEPALKPWLMWKAWERVRSVTNDAKHWEEQYEKEMAKLRAERFSIGRSRRIRGRRLHGLEQPLQNRYATTHTAEA